MERCLLHFGDGLEPSVSPALLFLFMRLFYKKDTVFTKNTFLGSGLSFAERFYVKEIALLLIVQLFFDLLRFGLNTISHPAMPLVFGALTALSWFVFYGILTKNFFKGKKIKVILLWLILGAAVYTVFAGLDYAQYATAAHKLLPDSEYLATRLKTFTYNCRIMDLALDVLLGSGIFLVDIHNKGAKPSPKLSRREWLMPLVARIMALWLCLQAFFIIKLLIAPASLAGNITPVYTEHSFSIGFYCESDELKITRHISHKEKELISHKVKYSIGYQDTHNIKKFHSDDLLCDGGYQKYLVEDVEVRVYYYYALCYVEDDVPKVVLFPEIKEQPKDDLLIEICKTAISEGNMVVFEYACEYLQAYALDFINPYIERYAKGDFWPWETEDIEYVEYRPEYIVSFAKKHL